MKLASRSVSGRLGKSLERLGEHLGGSWNGLSVLKRLGSVLERVRATSPFAGRAGGVHPPDKGETTKEPPPNVSYHLYEVAPTSHQNI